MRYLIATILLVLAPLSWGNDDIEWPVELTCDFGHSIIQLHISGDKKTSWFRAVYAINKGPLSKLTQKEMDKKLFKVKNIWVSPTWLSLHISYGYIGNPKIWIVDVDRHTLRANLNKRWDGNCKMGLLNVEETPRQF
jgi:hypothetical protein